MIGFIRHSISRKVMSAALVTTLLALLVTAGSMVVYDVSTYQTAWVNDLTAQADILARVTAPALEFDDPKSAQENLEQIQVRPSVLAAAIYSSNGALFARYLKDASTTIPHKAEPAGYTIVDNQISVFKAIKRQDETVGTVFITARYPLAQRMKKYVTILVAAMIGSLLIAALLSSWLQRVITRPILALTEVVRHVVEHRDFSVQVKKSTDDEIGILVDAFNSMLREVGERAEALRQLNNTLEQRIDDRTRELGEAHEQLRQAQKMEAIGQLTGGIAHDFNNLLAGISGNLELLQLHMTMGKTTDLERYTKAAMTSIDRAAALTHRLLAFSRRQTLDPKPINVRQLVASMEDLLKRTIGPSIRLCLRFDDGLWNTICDAHQLENGLLNLAINARDAMPNGGNLMISVENTHGVDVLSKASKDEDALNEFVTITVVDDGTGMTPEVLSRAIDPFFTTKPLGQGTGLGLSMLYGFVRQSNGHIRILSEPGKGTRVKLHLPRYHGDVGTMTKVMPPQPMPAAKSPVTVLLVDDERAVRSNLAELLETLGYVILQAEDGPSGLAIVRSGQRIDLLITDVGLPNGMNGRQFADAVREQYPRLKVLFITGYAVANTVGDGNLAEGMEVMTKPFKMDTFARKVGAMLEDRPTV
jgi:signal transduction histidine kinase/ActR/RegA family two-component response regulator